LARLKLTFIIMLRFSYSVDNHSVPLPGLHDNCIESRYAFIIMLL
jgi:hypothetical protein